MSSTSAKAVKTNLWVRGGIHKNSYDKITIILRIGCITLQNDSFKVLITIVIRHLYLNTNRKNFVISLANTHHVVSS
jgi:hypothetical protein